MAAIEVIAEGLDFPEGPVVMADGSVIVVEIHAGQITRCWGGGRKEVVAMPGGGPNGAAIGPDGALYVCNSGGLDLVKLQHARGAGHEGRIERVVAGVLTLKLAAGGLVAALGEVTVQAVVGNVQGAIGKPLDVDMVIVERGLLHRGERLDPVEALGLLAPEAVRVDHRLLVHGLVGRLVGQRVGCYFGANGVQGSRTHLSYLGDIVVVVWPSCSRGGPIEPFDDGSNKTLQNALLSPFAALARSLRRFAGV